MIKFENTEVVGWEHAIRGMRNPKNSWGKSDSEFNAGFGSNGTILGENDLKLMTTLCNAGTDHRKYMRMITVYVDITAPLYWWKEFDTYKVGTVANSCSTMHKLADKEFTLDDFSNEHLADSAVFFDLQRDGEKIHIGTSSLIHLNETIAILNAYREVYLRTKKKWYWWQMIQLLPSSYNQKRTVMLNYEVLANIYKPTSRRHHKLDEWNVDCDGSFCQWIKSLPYSELITGEEK